jgi:hypothetical protein
MGVVCSGNSIADTSSGFAQWFDRETYPGKCLLPVFTQTLRFILKNGNLFNNRIR